MVILLTGPDLYRSHQRLHQLREAFRQKFDPQGYNTVTLEADDISAESLRDAVTAGGLFASRRFVAVPDFAGSADLSVDDVSAVLASAARDDKTIVVIRETVTGKSTASRRPRRGAAKTKRTTVAGVQVPGAKVEEFPLLSTGQFVSWITAEAKQRAGHISTVAAEQLAVLCQNDTWRASSELDKLLAYAGNRPVTADDVQGLVNSPYESNIFSVTDAIGLGQTARAVQLVHRELAAGTHVLVLVAALAGHIRNLWLVQSVSQTYRSPTAIAQQTGLHPYVVQKSLAQSRRFPADHLRQLHHRLVELDRTLKSTSLDAETALDQFLMTAR